MGACCSSSAEEEADSVYTPGSRGAAAGGGAAAGYGSGSGSAAAAPSKKELAARIHTSRKLGSLKLSACALTRIPTDVLEHTEWRSVDLASNRITIVPDAVASWHRLRALNLAGNLVKELRIDLRQLTSLRKLDLRGNGLTSLPHLPDGLEELRLADNSRLDVDGLDASVVACADSLTVLDVSGCGVTRLPAWLCQCSSLQELDVSRNGELRSLRLESGGVDMWDEMPHLVTLRASDCDVWPNSDCVPTSLLRDSRVQTLDLSGNRMTQRALRNIPGMDQYIERAAQRATKGMSGGGGELHTLCGVAE